MQNFVLHKLPTQATEISNYNILKDTLEDEIIRSSPLLFIFCKDSDDTNCPSWQSRSKLSYIFVSIQMLKQFKLVKQNFDFCQDGLVAVAYVDCSSKDISCSKTGFQSATVYLPSGNSTLQAGIEIHSLNYLEIATQILGQLPEAELVDEESLEVILSFQNKPNKYLCYLVYRISGQS